MSDINFIETDALTIVNEMLTDAQYMLGEALYPGDARRMFILSIAPVVVGLCNKLNDTARQSMLRYARNEALDAIGERVGSVRIPAQKSNVTIRFSVSTGHPEIVIPIGTRVGTAGKLYFETIEANTVAVGVDTIDIICYATEADSMHNGLTSGQINVLIDQLPYIASVSNIDTSSGGADTEPDGDTEVGGYTDFRERIRLAASQFSTAGSSASYVYWARTADQTISDVTAFRSAAGQVTITVLCEGGIAAGQTVRDKVTAVLSGDTVRPLTDTLVVSAPTYVDYTINASYTINKSRSTEAANIQVAVASAIDDYISWQCELLDRDINPDELRKRMYAAGADTITITTPVSATVSKQQVARNTGSNTITYSGITP